MAQPMTLILQRDADHMAGDVGQIEIAGVVQPDRIALALPGRDGQGFGWGPMGSTSFGIGPAAQPFGGAPLGGGYFGQGTAIYTHRTVRSFVSGDYALRLRAMDARGNAGPWSDSDLFPHRATPAAPTANTLVGGTLGWSWSDS